MKNMRFIVLVLLLLNLQMFFIGCSSRMDGWAGTVEEIDGVTIVRNPQAPYYGELAIELEKDLEIGNDEDPNFRFYRVLGIDLDSKGNIYVLDSGNNRVQKFDSGGNYLLTIGREGEGPSEFLRLSGVFIDSEDTIYLTDRRRIQIFDGDGVYRDSITFENDIYDFFLDAGGHVYTFIMQSDEEGSKKYLVKYDKRGKIVQTFAEFSDVQAVQSQDDSGRRMAFKAYHHYNYWPYLSPLGDDGFIYAYPSDYVLISLNGRGNVFQKIEKDELSNPISRAEKDFIINRIEEAYKRRGRKPPRDVVEASCQFPAHRPYFYGMTVDDAGRIYIRKAPSVLDESDRVELDIFSKDGYYIYRTFLSFNPEIIREGTFYDIFTSDETGEVRIQRFRIKNWDQIEAGIKN